MSIFNAAQIEAMRKAAEKKQKAKEIRRRLRPIGEKYAASDEKFKVLARPYERRRKLDTSFNVNLKIAFEVVIRAINERGEPVDVTRIWATINGRNKDIRRPSKGKGKYGDFGPYVIPYKPTGTGISKLKVQTDGDEPSIIFYKIKQVT